MEITLEKIELVRDRTGVTYKEAKEALEAANGNVVDAIIAIEETIDCSEKNSTKAKKDALISRMKELFEKGNVSRIVVSREDHTFLNIPLNIGIVGTVIAPWGMIAGVVAALGFKCKIEFIKDDGSVIDLSEKANDFYDTAKEKGTDFYADMKEKAPEVYSDLVNKGGEAFNKAKDVAADVAAKAKSKVVKNDFADDIDLDNIAEAEEAVEETAKEAVDKAADAVKDAADTVKEKVEE